MDKVDKVTREENRTNECIISNKTIHELSILWIKSSLSTILPCLPGLAFTENIKNLHLSEGQGGVRGAVYKRGLFIH